MARNVNAMTPEEATGIWRQFQPVSNHEVVTSRVQGAFMVDLDLALTKPDVASVSSLAQQFDDLWVFDRFTSGEFVNPHFLFQRETPGSPLTPSEK